MDKRARDIRRHFGSRLAQRYGIRATRRVVKDVVSQIQDSTVPTFVEKQTNTRSIHRVVIDGSDVLVVYNHKYKIPQTVLFEGEEAIKRGYDRR